MDQNAFDDSLRHAVALRRDEPQKAVAELRQLAESRTPLTDFQIYNVYNLLSAFQSNDLGDMEAALATVDEGLAKVKSPQILASFYSTKATLLMAANKNDQAEALLADKLPPALAAGVSGNMRPLYIAVLQKRGKPDMALKLLTQLVEDSIDSKAVMDVVSTMVDQQLAVGHEDEAMSYAKLGFVLCDFDDKSAQAAMQVIAKVWTAKFMAPTKVQTMIDAQQDPTKPNPLRDVKLPAIDPALLQKHYEAATPAGRISIQIVRGEFRAAMVEARGLMLTQPQSSAGALEVCRVFKAHDLNLQRANAFLAYMRTGEGSNPVAEFLKEQTK